jgi:NADH dehydrogenase FAD-containing subunit
METTALPSDQTEVRLSDGSKLVTDFYVPTYGLVANSSYIPSKFLSSNGFVIVDDYLKAKGAGDVWAIGDVADVEWKQWIYMDRQSSYVAKNIVLILSNKAPNPYKITPASSRRIPLLVTFTLNYTDTLTTGVLGFSLGQKTGTGAFGSFKIPTFVLSWARKGLYTHMVDPTVSGTRF